MSGRGCWWSASSPISVSPPPRSASSRNIPTPRRSTLLRGFITGSRWLTVAAATAIAICGVLAVKLLEPLLADYVVLPLMVACVTLPFYALMQMQDGIARSYNWVQLALMPMYVIRHVVMLAMVAAAYVFDLPTDAMTVVGVLAVSLAVTAIGQTIALNRRIANEIGHGPKAYETRTWFSGFAADADGRRLLPDADAHRHPGAAAVPLARRHRNLLRGVEDHRSGVIRLLRGVGRGRAPVHRVSRHRRPRAARRIPFRLDPLDVLALARRHRRNPADGQAATGVVRPGVRRGLPGDDFPRGRPAGPRRGRTCRTPAHHARRAANLRRDLCLRLRAQPRRSASS